jgi:hypothetical protein
MSRCLITIDGGCSDARRQLLYKTHLAGCAVTGFCTTSTAALDAACRFAMEPATVTVYRQLLCWDNMPRPVQATVALPPDRSDDILGDCRWAACGWILPVLLEWFAGSCRFAQGECLCPRRHPVGVSLG